MDSNVLFKFRDWENSNHKKVLTSKELYFSSIRSFNDPFDSDIRINYEDLSWSDQVLLIKKHVDRDCPNLTTFQKIVETYKRLDDSALGNTERLKKHYEEIVKPANESEIGILSLAGTKYNHLLWSHYSNKHRGFCVGFPRKKLKEFADKITLQNKLMDLCKVNYQKEYPDLNPAKMTHREYFEKPFTIKSKYWSYEEEERLIFKDKSDVALNFEVDMYAEVNLGLKICEEHKKEIIDVINTNFKNVKIYQARRMDRSFQLIFDEIN